MRQFCNTITPLGYDGYGYNSVLPKQQGQILIMLRQTIHKSLPKVSGVGDRDSNSNLGYSAEPTFAALY